MGEAVSRPFHKRKTEAPRKDPRASQSQLYGAPEDGVNSSFISDGICSQEGAEPGGRGGARLNSFLPSLKPVLGKSCRLAGLQPVSPTVLLFPGLPPNI